MSIDATNQHDLRGTGQRRSPFLYSALEFSTVVNMTTSTIFLLIAASFETGLIQHIGIPPYENRLFVAMITPDLNGLLFQLRGEKKRK